MNHTTLRPGEIHVSHRLLHSWRRLANGLGLVMVAFLALDHRFGWLRHRPGGEAFDLNEQPYFMALFAIGVVLSLRWRLVGGALAAFTSAGLIVFAARQLRSIDAVFVLIGFMVPALLWVTVGLFELRDERFHRLPDQQPRPLLRRRDVLGGIAVLGITVFGGIRVGNWLFDRIYGPTHPSSKAAVVRGSSTRWIWSGAVTDQSATVTARLEEDDEASVQLLVARSENLEDATAIDGMSDDEGVVRVEVSDLEPNTQYHYALVVDGEVDRARVGRFRTHPVGPTELKIAVGSCSRTGSNGAVFDAIRSLDPDLVIIGGDLHYGDITRNDPQAFRQVLDHTLSRPAQAALFQQSAVAYVWDDHDFGGQDRDSDSRPAAMAVYRQFVPHHPLASLTSAIYQSFSIGRVRVLLTDARSERRPADDDKPGTMLGAEQKRWLLDELLAARDSHVLTIWANPVPWIAAESEPSDDEAEGDDWGGYPEERKEIARFIAEHGIASSLLMVSGDAHMVAIDDGTNSDYSAAGAAGFPVFHAGALDRPGSVKGGPYSHGAVPGGGQFGLVSIADDGSTVDVTLTARRWTNEILLEHRFSVL